MKSFIADRVTASRHDAGNIEYAAHEVEGQPGAFIIFELWESREALEGHLLRVNQPELPWPRWRDKWTGS